MPAPTHTPAEQERMILEASAQCILDTSLIDFKMSAIAKQAGLSMGSVYKHIQSKEDVLVALSVQLNKRASKVIKKILSLPHPLPTKIVAINLVSEEAMYKYPFGYQLMTMINSEDLRAKASEKWLLRDAQISEEIRTYFKLALIEAVANQELLCNADEQEDLIEEFILMHWAVSVGIPQIVNYPYSASITENTKKHETHLSLDHPILKAAIRMTNSYPWKTPTSRADLEAVGKIIESIELD